MTCLVTCLLSVRVQPVALLKTSGLAASMFNLLNFHNVLLVQNMLFFGLIHLPRKFSTLIYLLIDVLKWNYSKPNKKAKILLKMRVYVVAMAVLDSTSISNQQINTVLKTYWFKISLFHYWQNC